MKSALLQGPQHTLSLSQVKSRGRPPEGLARAGGPSVREQAPAATQGLGCSGLLRCRFYFHVADPAPLSHSTVECSVLLRGNREVDVRGHLFIDLLNVVKIHLT